MTQLDTNLGPLALSLAKAQAEFPAIVRDKEVDSRSYKFKYAPLDSIIAAVRPALSKNGLAFVQVLDGDDLETILLHESGASVRGRVALPREGTVQQLGSAITYFRRYALQAILGVAAEEDDDGDTAATRTRAPQTARRTDVDRSTGEVLPQRVTNGARPAAVATPIETPGLSEADVAALHARFGEDGGAPFTDDDLSGIAPTGGLSTIELFSRAEKANVTKPQLTLAAKALFGANRWKITDLDDGERAQVWEEVAP